MKTLANTREICTKAPNYLDQGNRICSFNIPPHAYDKKQLFPHQQNNKDTNAKGSKTVLLLKKQS